MTYPDGARYEGSFRDDQFDGEGVYRFPDGRELAGEFRAGVFYGQAAPRREAPASKYRGRGSSRAVTFRAECLPTGARKRRDKRIGGAGR